jgi:hypothetical protein
VQLDAGLIRAGSPLLVSGTAPPGSPVVVWAYSRPNTTYRAVRRLAADADGSFRTFVFPGTNTRLYVEAAGQVSRSIVVLVRPLVSLRADGSGRTYTFTGTVKPARAGVLVTLYRVTPLGEVIAAQGRTDARGVYRIRRVFLGTGIWTFIARTGNGLVNVAAAGPPRRVRLR